MQWRGGWGEGWIAGVCRVTRSDKLAQGVVKQGPLRKMKQPLLRDIIVVGGSIMQITAEETRRGVEKDVFKHYIMTIRKRERI